MKSAIRNILLILALSAIILIIVGLFLYDYMPSSTTVAKANVYEPASDTTKVLSDITTESQEIFNKQSNTSSNSSVTPGIVLKTYSVSSTDLKVYASRQEYEKGKSDPFDPWNAENENAVNGTVTNTPNTPAPTNEVISDGTMYNSTHTK